MYTFFTWVFPWKRELSVSVFTGRSPEGAAAKITVSARRFCSMPCSAATVIPFRVEGTVKDV